MQVNILADVLVYRHTDNPFSLLAVAERPRLFITLLFVIKQLVVT